MMSANMVGMKERPFRTTKLTKKLKQDLEEFAAKDGLQRGAFFDTSGNFRTDAVSATSEIHWLFKTKNGKPFNW